jgi:hypothetical protein
MSGAAIGSVIVASVARVAVARVAGIAGWRIRRCGQITRQEQAVTRLLIEFAAYTYSCSNTPTRIFQPLPGL